MLFKGAAGKKGDRSEAMGTVPGAESADTMTPWLTLTAVMQTVASSYPRQQKPGLLNASCFVLSQSSFHRADTQQQCSVGGDKYHCPWAFRQESFLIIWGWGRMGVYKLLILI